MKKSIKSFITFTRSERVGLIALCSLLLILIAIRATMSLWVHPSAPDKEQEQRLVAAWETFKRSQPVPKESDATETAKSEYQKASDESETPLPDTININTADSETLVRLKGIGPVTAHRIIERRKTKGSFTSVDQLKDVAVINGKAFELLKKHLTVGNQ